MGKVVSMVGQKGGVGKSALARLIAVEGMRAGLTVRIMDLDPSQGTTTQWALRRDKNEIEPEVAVEKCRTVAAALKRVAETDLLIMDGPAFADRTTLEMAKPADLVLLPTGLGLDDMPPQIEAAYELEEKGIATDRIRLVFCRAKGSSEEVRRARKFVAPTGLLMAEGVMRELASIRLALNDGRAPSETGFASVDADAQRLGAEVLGLLNITQKEAITNG